MRFSERYGYKPVREIIQKESIDNDLKNTLWSLLQLSIFEKVEYEYQYGQVDGSNLKILLFSYWYHFFKKPIDTIPSYTSDAIDILRKEFFKMPWHSIYSFIEITLIFYPEKVNSKQSLDFLHKSFFNQFNCLSFTQSKLYMPASKLNRRFNLLRRFLYTQDKILKHFKQVGPPLFGTSYFILK